MKQVKIENIDKLRAYIAELSCIAYLQDITQYENACALDDFCELWYDTKDYLIKKELEIIGKIRNLLKERDFEI